MVALRQSPVPLETLGPNFPSLFGELDGDFAMYDIAGHGNLTILDSSDDAIAPRAYAPTPIPPPTPVQATRQIPTPPASASRFPPSSDLGDSQLPQPFLRQVNDHLRADNAALQDEVAVLRRTRGMLQGQLDELGSQLRPLDELVQGLLHLPAVQEGDEQVVRQLFSILDQISRFKRILRSCQD